MSIKEFIESNGIFYSDIICKDENGNECKLIWGDSCGINTDMELRNKDGIVLYGDTVPLENVETFEVLGDFESIDGRDNGGFPESYDRRVKVKLSFYAHDEYKHEKDIEHIYSGCGYVYFRSAEGDALGSVRLIKGV